MKQTFSVKFEEYYPHLAGIVAMLLNRRLLDLIQNFAGLI